MIAIIPGAALTLRPWTGRNYLDNRQRGNRKIQERSRKLEVEVVRGMMTVTMGRSKGKINNCSNAFGNRASENPSLDSLCQDCVQARCSLPRPSMRTDKGTRSGRRGYEEVLVEVRETSDIDVVSLGTSGAPSSCQMFRLGRDHQNI